MTHPARLVRLLALALLTPALLALLAACDRVPSSGPRRPAPALWELTGPDGARGWLFGTIHALPAGTPWRTPVLAGALDRAGVLVLELREIGDPGRVRAAFERRAVTHGLPPLDARLAPARRPDLARLLRRERMAPRDFAAIETWAAALILAGGGDAGDALHGVDAALLARWGPRPVAELEGADRQFAIFDALPEAAQRALLAAVVDERDGGEQAEAALRSAWLAGDLPGLAREAHTGLLADPALRAALLDRRNVAWVGRIAALVRSGRRPFVAVGAAHCTGATGLPALLAAQGFTVRRIQ